MSIREWAGRVRLKACVGCAALLNILVQAAYAETSVNELCDAVARCQSRISRFEMKYHSTHGSLSSRDVLSGDFVPTDPPHVIDGVMGVDYQSGAQYLRQDVLAGGMQRRTECAFDGEIGTQLVSVGADIGPPWQGVIIGDRPGGLVRENRVEVKPNDMAYGIIPEFDLASAIRQSPRTTIEKDTLDGTTVHKVSFIVQRKMIVEANAQQQEGTTEELYRVWLDREHSMLPMRFEYLRQRNMGDLDGTVSRVQRVLALREIAPGVWYPVHSRSYVLWIDPNRPVSVIDTEILEAKINDDAHVPSRVRFPDGTAVTDVLKHVKYRVELSPRRMDDGVEEAVQTVRGGSDAVASGHSAASRAEDEEAPLEVPQNTAFDKRNWWRGHWPLLALAAGVILIVSVGGLVVLRRRRGPVK